MKFFASLTNSGCESRMAEFDVIVYSGGSVPVSKISNKQLENSHKSQFLNCILRRIRCLT